MDQIERITHMENILNEAKEALSALEKALDRYDAVREGLAELEAYYSGRLWRILRTTEREKFPET